MKGSLSFEGTAKSSGRAVLVALVIPLALSLAMASCSARNPLYDVSTSPGPAVDANSPLTADADSQLAVDAPSQLADRPSADSGDLARPAVDGQAAVPDGPSIAKDAGAQFEAGALRVVIDGLNETKQYGSSTSSTPLSDSCPPDQVLIGFQGSTSDVYNFVGSVQGTCGVLTIESVGSSYQVVVRAGPVLKLRGETTGIEWSAPCPQSQMVVGFMGRAGGSLDQVGFQCAPLLISVDGPAPKLSIGTVTKLATYGGTGGNAFQEPCPPGQVARGYVTRTGSSNLGAWLDSLDLLCGTPAIAP